MKINFCFINSRHKLRLCKMCISNFHANQLECIQRYLSRNSQSVVAQSHVGILLLKMDKANILVCDFCVLNQMKHISSFVALWMYEDIRWPFLEKCQQMHQHILTMKSLQNEHIFTLHWFYSDCLPQMKATICLSFNPFFWYKCSHRFKSSY